MSYHVETTHFDELPNEIVVHEDGYLGAYKNYGEPIVDYTYTLMSDREAKLIKAINDVLCHSKDTVWVDEAETLADRMVSLGVYGQEVYEGARPWEVER